MKKRLLKVKGRFEGKKFVPTHVKIDEDVACHSKNKNLNLIVGYNDINGGCTVVCPEDTDKGYYQCAGGNCIFIPYG